MKQRPDLQYFLNSHRRFAGRVPGVQSTNPLIRALSWMAMIVLLGVSMVVGFVLLVVLLIGGLMLASFFKVRSLFSRSPHPGRRAPPEPQGPAAPESTPSSSEQIIEGDFEVVQRKSTD